MCEKKKNYLWDVACWNTEPVQSAWAAGDGKIHTQRGHRLLRCALQVVRGPACWHEQFGLFHISLTGDGGLYFHHEKFVCTSYKGAKNQPLLRGGSRPQPLKSKDTRALWNMLLPSCSGHPPPPSALSLFGSFIEYEGHLRGSMSFMCTEDWHG